MYITQQPGTDQYYELTFDSPNGYFKLVRHINEGSLFAELNALQGYFFLVVMLVLLVGGILTLVLTYYNEYPIKKLLLYSKEKVQGIPDDIDGLEAFQFAMKSLEDQVTVLEHRQRRSRLLLQLVYGKDCDTKYFQNAMKKESFFENAECYRVILTVSDSIEDEMVRNEIELYMNRLEKKGYEISLIDTLPRRFPVAEAGKAGRRERYFLPVL